jgi:MoaA/NifB/PqqE/SkfB family radical SAM enzyme
MCARNFHGGISNPNIIKSNIDLKLFKNSVGVDFLKQLSSISMCGNFGDPILNNDLIKIIQYINENNPEIYFDLHTHGSARSLNWWKELAETIPKNHIIHFGIDGLEDTHHLYRIGTDFNKIIENAKMFIEHGGKARWSFITFKHNEHQIELARELSRKLNFESFQEKQTARFIGSTIFNVIDKDTNITHILQPPGDQKISLIDYNTAQNYEEIIKSSTIHCEVESTRSIYIDAQGRLWPCTWLAGVLYQYTTTDDLTWKFIEDSKQSLIKVIDSFGGIDGLNLRLKSIEEIVNSEIWQTIWNIAFLEKSIPMCARICGKFPKNKIGQCRDEFVDLERFNNDV